MGRQGYGMSQTSPLPRITCTQPATEEKDTSELAHNKCRIQLKVWLYKHLFTKHMSPILTNDTFYIL